MTLKVSGPSHHGHSLLGFEVKASYGCFARPDASRLHPQSYPFPTWGAVKGMVERIQFARAVRVIPCGVQILAPTLFTNYAFTYAGPDRKPTMVIEDNPAICSAQILCRPHFRLLFAVVGTVPAQVGRYLERLTRSIRQGDHPPVGMGWSEFICEVKLNTEAATIHDSYTVPLMVKSPFEQGWFRNVRVERGTVWFEESV